MGNAAYNSDELYEELRPAVPYLTALLQGEGDASEDKIKANAAGALGNLVRNSAKLCRDFIELGTAQVGVGWGTGAGMGWRVFSNVGWAAGMPTYP